MIETGDDLKAARERLGWSLTALAEALRLGDTSTKSSATRIREMEAGTRPIAGPTAVAVEAFLTGFRPEGFHDGTD